MNNLLLIIGFVLAVIGAGFLGLAITVHAINYWEGLF